MKISQNSTQSLYNNLRHSMANLQRDLIEAQTQVSTGRVSDAGLHLGEQNGRRISMNADIQRMGSIASTNGIAQVRLEMSLSATGAIREIGQELTAAFTASTGQSNTAAITEQAGQSAIATITGMLNTTLNGEALFGGINSDTSPIASYEDGGPKAALDAAFLAHFGFAKTDPTTSSITSSAMADFLDTVVEPMFTGSDWQTHFSGASDDVIDARIGLTETSKASVSANEPGFRNVMFVAVIAGEFFTEGFNAGAQAASAQKALAVIGKSSGDLAELEGRIGFLSNRIEASTVRLNAQVDELTTYADKMDSVDPYEAATSLNYLVGQIETSYRLTGRIQQLSLMRFI